MVHGGACLAHLGDGIPLFVDGAIPGERVVAELAHRRRRSWFGRVIEVIEPDAARVAPPCAYLPECGGCQLQHVAYSRQLELKRAIVADALRHQSVPLRSDPVIHGMDEPWKYRWRGEFHVVRDADGRARGLGFNRARSWTPVPVDECLIHHPLINDSLGPLRELVERGGRQELTLLHLTVGEGGHELLLRPKPKGALDAAAVDAAAAAAPPGVRWSTDATTLTWRGRTFRVRPETFIQVNWTQMDVLYQLVVDALGDLGGQRLVDGYAGVGVMSVLLAETAREVVCIEENRASAQLGVLNARMNGVAQRVRYVPEPVEHALPRVAGEAPVDAVILDPPRAGCDSRITAWLALTGPRRIVYVSCDPATLARDLRVLVGSGPYDLGRLDLVDMFPQTAHVESVATLVRR